MYGARAFRHVFLFRRAIIIAKKKAEGLLLVKAFIMVSICLLCTFVKFIITILACCNSAWFLRELFINEVYQCILTVMLEVARIL